jgi:hypothetical protein
MSRENFQQGMIVKFHGGANYTPLGNINGLCRGFIGHKIWRMRPGIIQPIDYFVYVFGEAAANYRAMGCWYKLPKI